MAQSFMYTIPQNTVADDLNARLEAGIHVTAIIDSLADNALVTTFFNDSPHISYKILFLGTPLEHVLEVSPYVLEIKDMRDAFCRYLLEHHGGWGFFAASAVPLHETIQHWKSLLQIYSDNTVTHFRFYDRQVLYSLWPVLSAMDAASLLGPHFCLYLPPALPEGDGKDGRENIWSQISHPSSGEPPQAIAKRYIPREAPWWTLTDEYWKAFEDKRPGIMANNVMEYLFETYPAQAGAKHARMNLDAFCLSHVQRSGDFGITDQETVTLFVACCLFYGDLFPVGMDIAIPATPGQEAALANDLRTLCEKAVHNG